MNYGALIGLVFGVSAIFNSIICRRVLKPVLNPECPNPDSCSRVGNRTNASNNLIYYVSDSNNDRLHVLISSVDGFTILFVKSDSNSTLKIDWNAFLAKNFTQNCIGIDGNDDNQSFAVSITKIFRHDYDKDFKPLGVQSIKVANLFWYNASIDDNDFSIQLITNKETENTKFLGDGGSLVFTFRVFDQESTFSTMPRLQHNDQSSQLDVELKNFSSFGYNITRYGLEMSIVSSAQRLDGVFIDERISMNDEPTPGVFETDVLIDRKDNAFILWKSACYDQPERGLTSLMGVRHDDLVLPHIPNVNDLGSLALGFYTRYLNGRQVRNFNLTFGANSDRSYKDYLVWTFDVGFGAPPGQMFSFSVIGLMAVCIISPLVALIAGCCYGFRRMGRGFTRFR